MARARLSMAFQDVRGRMNDQVLTRTREGLVTKHRPRYKYPKVAAVQAGNDRLRQATLVWNDLTAAEVEAWRTYALSLSRRDPVTLEWYSPTAQNAFIGLAVKVVQVGVVGPGVDSPPPTPFSLEKGGGTLPHPWAPSPQSGEGETVIPRTPPATDFRGDSIRVAVEAAAGGLRFTPTAPNASGVVTELMVQKLPNPRRAPVKFYKLLAFVPFAGPVDVPMEPGIYALGYRFVRAATGQMTDMMPMGTVTVE